jgi:hypothetical protein
MDEMQQLLALCGATTFAEGVTVLTALNTHIESARAALGTRGTSDTLMALVSRHSRLAALEKAAGKDGDEADGLFRAALVSHTELPKAHAELAQLRKDGQVAELDKAITKAKADSKLTKASEDQLRKAFADGDITLKGALAQLEHMPVIPALAAAKDGRQPAAPDAVPDVEAKLWNGKKWAELTGPERVQLLQQDKALYTAMRDASRG